MSSVIYLDSFNSKRFQPESRRLILTANMASSDEKTIQLTPATTISTSNTATLDAETTQTVSLSTDATSTPIPSPILHTPQTLLRAYHRSDAPALSSAANSLLISRYMTNLFPSPYALPDAYHWISISTERVPLRNFAIFDPAGTTLLGGIGLKPGLDVEARTFEIGYWIAEAAWGRGVATEVVRAFSKWAFENIPGLGRLEAGVFAPNEASARVLTKAGYTFEGVRRKAVEKKGVVMDVKMFALLKEECVAESML